MKQPPPKPHSCLHNGHVWVEADGSLYVRHRDRTGTVPVTCLYCDESAELPAHGKATMRFQQEVTKATATLRKDRALATKLDTIRNVFASASVKIDS